MQIPEELVDRARRLDRTAVEAVLTAAYPAVYRIARALWAADEPAARDLAALVLRRAVRVMPAWRPGAAAEHWFYHHTVLATRVGGGPPDDPRRDPLAAGHADPAYVALVRAVRLLPPQQAEAFLLHHGERLNPRLLAVAMDCSTAAATQHLQTATEALTAVAGGSEPLESFTSTLSRVYPTLGPAPDAVGPTVRAELSRVLRPRRLRRVLKALFWLALLGALAYAAWRWRDDLVRLWQQATSR